MMRVVLVHFQNLRVRISFLGLRMVMLRLSNQSPDTIISVFQCTPEIVAKHYYYSYFYFLYFVFLRSVIPSIRSSRSTHILPHSNDRNTDSAMQSPLMISIQHSKTFCYFQQVCEVARGIRGAP